MLETIKEIIVKWDPIGLMEYAPSDEYDYECYLILHEFKKNQKSLAEIIHDVFNDNFGEVFQDDLSKCVEIAMEIESKIGKN